MFNQYFSRKISLQIKWMFLLIIVPLYFYCSSVIGTAILKFLVIQFSFQWDYITLNTYLNFLVDSVMLILVGWIMKDTMIEQWKDFKKNLKDNVIYGALIGTALIYVVGILGGMITLMLGGSSNSENQQMIETIMNVHPLLMAITTIFFAPILEEMIFRGIVFGWLYELSPKLAHFISAFIFGFIHVMMAILSGNISEWVQIFSYFFMGFVLSYLYEKKNNIYVPILAHMSNNFISVMLMMI
ncbi:CPBP family intramembrane glutamic endopeptidase [Longibaculum muris]|uniref:CPBP family intramembrane glutamic endopeptidase n=1 Tax=Longibaculum muris TaxID=1796628 RepID=UPI0022E133D6|nr:type II CAAX endopeptidase family protein [Longibaculum muris]